MLVIIIIIFSKTLFILIWQPLTRFGSIRRWQSLSRAVFFFAGIHRVLQRAGGGEHPGQLCGCLWAPGWIDGLWIPSNDRQQDPTRVSYLDRQDRFSLKTLLVKKMKNPRHLYSELTHFLQIHHSAGDKAGGCKIQGANHSHQRRVLEVRGDQIQEEWGLHWCHWVHQCTGKVFLSFETKILFRKYQNNSIKLLLNE